MNVALVKIGTEITSRYGTNAGRRVKVYYFKDIDNGLKYSMNLPLEIRVAIDWIRHLQLGNIFKGVQIQPNGKNIDYYQGFKSVEIKDMNKIIINKVERTR